MDKKRTTKIKSSNKAAGLKSTLVSGDNLYLTSFGKGNSAVLEQKVETASVASDGNYSVTPMLAEPSLRVKGAKETAVSFTSSRPYVKK